MNNGEELLNELKLDLISVFDSAPQYGSVGMNIVFHDGYPVRVDSSKSVVRKVTKEEK